MLFSLLLFSSGVLQGTGLDLLLPLFAAPHVADKLDLNLLVCYPVSPISLCCVSTLYTAAGLRSLVSVEFYFVIFYPRAFLKGFSFFQIALPLSTYRQLLNRADGDAYGHPPSTEGFILVSVLSLSNCTLC